jgi:hypothetical protein
MLLERGKKKCDCGNTAVWVYMPGYGDGSNPYICDDCVSSPDDIGCSCNWHYGKEQEGLPTDLPEGIEGKDWRWIEHEGDEYVDKISKEEDGYWQYLDERGRPYPCSEYEYDKDGFPELTWLGDKVYDLSYRWYFFKIKLKNKFISWKKKHIVDDIPKNLENNF